MTEHADLLRTIAQISIAFAGFAGVIATFGRFHLAPEATVFRVRMMVGVALVTLLYSLLPFLLREGRTEVSKFFGFRRF